MILKISKELIEVLKSKSIKYFLNDDNTKVFVNDNYINDLIEFDFSKISTKYKLVSNEFSKKRKIIISNEEVDFEELLFISGPCSIKDKESLFNVAKKLKEQGIKYFRAGAYKPRTSPHDFQGYEEEGLQLLKEVKEKFDLRIVSEIMDQKDIEKFEGIVDIFQVGARNMQNFTLLKALGKTNTAVLLKRGLSATMEEFVLSAEYIIASGNQNVILCERGIRTFEPHTRNTFDLSVVPFVKQNTNLPIIVDPSHAVGKREYVHSMSIAGIAAGADGIMIESDIVPEETNTDIDQTISLKNLKKIQDDIEKLSPIVGKRYGTGKTI